MRRAAMHWPSVLKELLVQNVARLPPGTLMPLFPRAVVSEPLSLSLRESTSPGELLLELLLPCVEELVDAEFPAEEPRGVLAPPVPGWLPLRPPCAHADAPASHRITTSESTVTMERF